MDLTRTRGADWLAALGGLLVLVSLFLPWYGVVGFGVSGWESLSVIDVLLALVALTAMAVPLVVASRDSPAVPLTVTVVAAALSLIAVLLVLVRVVWEPDFAGAVTISFGGTGEGLFDVTRRIGLWVALAGSIVLLIGVWRSLRDEHAPSLRPSPTPERQPAPAA